jgi:hypothetical protein
MRSVRNTEHRGLYAVGLKVRDFVDKRAGINRRPWSDDAGGTRVKDARRNEVKREASEFIVNAVAGVRAAVISDHHVGAGCEIVDELALALIAPMTANHSGNAQLRAPFIPAPAPCGAHAARILYRLWDPLLKAGAIQLAATYGTVM